jgi:NAD-dependent SIR2 family protein deacetylase
MAAPLALPAGFKEDLQKTATKHIKRAQEAERSPTPLLPIPESEIKSFKQHLKSSDRILALFGAGLSAPSGLSTFRGTQDIFRGYDPPMLSTIQKFREDPILMWWYHANRRKKMMEAEPNAAHYALAKLGRVKPNFLAVTQNIDSR